MHRFWTVYPNERSNIFEFEASEVIQTHDVMMRTILNFYGMPLYQDLEDDPKETHDDSDHMIEQC